MTHQESFFIKPKKIFQLWLCWAQHHQSKKKKLLENVENAKESLFKGESSDGKRSSKPLGRVPKGYVAVYVGPELRRYVIPMVYLSMPDFRVLMDNVAEEFGFEHEGGLQFPCDEEEFQDTLLRCIVTQQKMPKKKKKELNSKKIYIG